MRTRSSVNERAPEGSSSAKNQDAQKGYSDRTKDAGTSDRKSKRKRVARTTTTTKPSKVKLALAATSEPAADQLPVPFCKHINSLVLDPKVRELILSPADWACGECGTTDGIWACLHCGHFGCGRNNVKHGLQHYRTTKHPLVLDIVTKLCHCYACNNYVANDTSSGDVMTLREALSEVEEPTVVIHRTRSGRAIRASGPMSPVHQEQMWASQASKDKLDTAVFTWRFGLLQEAFNAWRSVVRSAVSKRDVEQSKSSLQPPVHLQPDSKPAAVLVVRDPRDPKPKKRRKPAISSGMTGLRNLGQTCFLNSVLQMLAHTPMIVATFRELGKMGWLDQNVEPAQNTIEPMPTHAAHDKRNKFKLQRRTTMDCHKRLEIRPALLTKRRRAKQDVMSKIEQEEERPVHLLSDLEALFRVLWSQKWAVVTPHQILASVWRLFPAFQGYKQQDSQELLCGVEGRIVEELVTLRQQMSDTWVIDLMMAAFEGEITASVHCKNCRAISSHTETFLNLSIDFPLKICGDITLHSLLEQYVAEEMLSGDVYHCDNCSVEGDGVHYRSAARSSTISLLPGVLRIHLKRFRWSGVRRGKITKHVSFPLTLNMEAFCADETAASSLVESAQIDITTKTRHQAFNYSLSGIIVHDGRGANAGHYRAFCYNTLTDSWVQYNDARVSEVDVDSLLESQAYILCYTNDCVAQRLSKLDFCSDMVFANRAPG